MFTLNEQNFSQEVVNKAGVTLVDFWAPWCMPCRMLSPILDKVSLEYSNKAKVGKVNVDENPAIASQYGIMAIPTMIVFKNGKEVKRVSGVVPESGIKSLIDQAIAGD